MAKHAGEGPYILALPRMFVSADIGQQILKNLPDDLRGMTVEINGRGNLHSSESAVAALLAGLLNQRKCANVYTHLVSPEFSQHFETIQEAYYKENNHDNQ